MRADHLRTTEIATMKYPTSVQHLPHPGRFTGTLADDECRVVSFMSQQERTDETWRTGLQLSDCGTGKTRMMLACIATNEGTTIIVTLPTLVRQWRLRIAQIIPTFASSIQVLDYTSIDRLEVLLASHRWDRLVLDEAHGMTRHVIDRIRPFLPKRLAATENPQFVWLVTGTPSLYMYERMLSVFFQGLAVNVDRRARTANVTIAQKDQTTETSPLSDFLCRVSIRLTVPPRRDLIRNTKYIGHTKRWQISNGCNDADTARVDALRSAVMTDLGEQGEQVCPVCIVLKCTKAFRILPCGHYHCRDCTRNRTLCPTCYSPLRTCSFLLENDNGDRLDRLVRYIETLVVDIQRRSHDAGILVLSVFGTRVRMIRDRLEASGIAHADPGGAHQRRDTGGLLVGSIPSIRGLNLPIPITHIILAEPQIGHFTLSAALSHVYGGRRSYIQMVTLVVCER
jgi:hypothetical protein